jgi:hypothetical protein
LGDNIHCFALFEGEGRWNIENPQTSVIALDDVDLVQALEILGVALEGVNT